MDDIATVGAPRDQIRAVDLEATRWFEYNFDGGCEKDLPARCLPRNPFSDNVPDYCLNTPRRTQE